MKFLNTSLFLFSLLATTSSNPLVSAKDLAGLAPIEQSLLLSQARSHANLRAHSRGLHRIPRTSLSAHRRATQLQAEQAAALANWNEQFHEMNANWQVAANAALAKGETPPTFDEYAKQNGFSMDPNVPQAAGAASSSDAAPKQATQQQQPASSPSSSSSSTTTTSNNADDGEEDCSDASGETSSSSAASSTNTSTPKSQPKTTPSAPQPSASSEPPSTSGGSGSSGSMKAGKATFYDPSVGAGSCGKTFQSSDYIIALNIAEMQAADTSGNPNENPLCFKKVVMSHNGKSVTAQITDTCPGCQGANSVDMSPGLFDALASDYERTVAQSFTVDWTFA